MGILVYQLVIFVIYVSAFIDMVWPAKRTSLRPMLINRPGYDRLFRRFVLPITIAWLAAQLLAGVAFFFSGNLPRASGSLLLHVVNGLFFTILIPAGVYWSLRTGAPALPLLRWRSGSRKRTETRWPFSMFVLLAVAPIAATAGLLSAIEWQVTDQVQSAMRVEQHPKTSNLFFFSYLLISAAVTEEMLMRHYLLNRLRGLFRGRIGTCVAVVATSVIFALGHSSMISPTWLKYAQIFCLGISLGVCQILLGIEACIGLHLLFNASVVVMAVLAVSRLG